MNTGNTISNGTVSDEKYPFDELAKFIAKRTSQNEGLQNWMVDNSLKQGVVDVTALTRFAQSASIHVKDNLDLDFSFTDADNKVHHRNLTETETAKLQSILTDDKMNDSNKLFKLGQFFTSTSASILAKENFSNMMSQDRGVSLSQDVSNTLHR